MPAVLITGSNRGIGLEFVRQYAADGWRVFACCRNPAVATQLKTLVKKCEHIKVFALDVTSKNQIQDLAQELKSETIDVLINNAGYYGNGGGLNDVDEEEWLNTLKVNVLAPFFISEAFIEHVARSERKLIAFLSSKMGSLADNTSGGSYLYRSSKAGVNQVARSLSIDLADRGVQVALLHPGWVQTDMGGVNALIDVQTSVEGLRKVLNKFNLKQSGRFFAFDGSEIPW